MAARAQGQAGGGNTRAYAVRTVEKRLRELGIAHGDTDRAVDAGDTERIAAAVGLFETTRGS